MASPIPIPFRIAASTPALGGIVRESLAGGYFVTLWETDMIFAIQQ
jgi:hypothetical protein